MFKLGKILFGGVTTVFVSVFCSVVSFFWGGGGGGAGGGGDLE